MSTENMFFIGDASDYKKYKEACGSGKTDVKDLPVKNLPMSYFPFFYNTSESSVAKMQRLVPLFENYTKSLEVQARDSGTAQASGTAGTCKTEQAASHNIDTDTLFALLSQLEESYQPYNNNNAFHITVVVVLIWSLVAIALLKILHSYFKNIYVKLIMGCIFLLLLFGVIWTLFVTNTVL
jgi:hypothetical protein